MDLTEKQQLSVTNKDYIPLTQEMVDALKYFKALTGWGFIAIHNWGMEEDGARYKKFKPESAENWLSDNRETVPLTDYQAMIDAYKSLPEKLYHCSKKMKNPKQLPRMAIDDQFKSKMNDIYSRPQLKLSTILKYTDTPQGISYQTIRNIVTGRTKSLEASQYNFLDQLYHKVIENLKNNK